LVLVDLGMADLSDVTQVYAPNQQATRTTEEVDGQGLSVAVELVVHQSWLGDLNCC
jgi:hypothetical protein